MPFFTTNNNAADDCQQLTSAALFAGAALVCTMLRRREQQHKRTTTTALGSGILPIQSGGRLLHVHLIDPPAPTTTSNEGAPNDKPKNLAKERGVFVEAFCASYTEIPEAMQLFDETEDQLVAFLNEAFDEEEEAYWRLAVSPKQEPVRFLAFRGVSQNDDMNDDKDVVAFLSLDWNQTRNAVYIRQFAVAPKWQRQGVGRAFVTSVLEQMVARITENDATRLANNNAQTTAAITPSFHICVRKFNKSAIGFYKALGFQQESGTVVQEHGLDSAQYAAMSLIHRRQ